MTARPAGATGAETEYSKLKNSSSGSSSDDGLSQVVIPPPTISVRRVKRLRRRKDYDCLKQKPPPKTPCITLPTCGAVCAGFIIFAAVVSLGVLYYRLSRRVTNLQVESDAALAKLEDKVLSAEALVRELILNVSALGEMLRQCGPLGGGSSSNNSVLDLQRRHPGR